MREANQQISTVGDNVKSTQDATSVAAIAKTNNLAVSTPSIPQTKIDATDRRQIEAQNEDKSHSTKEALDDIKSIHYKEKQKKEQDNQEPGPSGMDSKYLRVSKTLILLFSFPSLFY